MNGHKTILTEAEQRDLDLLNEKIIMESEIKELHRQIAELKAELAEKERQNKNLLRSNMDLGRANFEHSTFGVNGLEPLEPAPPKKPPSWADIGKMIKDM